MTATLVLASLCILAAPLHTAAAELLIGRLGSVKSPIASPSTIAAAEGLDLYLKRINDAGGINGQKLRVIFKDDEFKPPMVVSNAAELIEKDKVLVLVLPQGTRHRRADQGGLADFQSNCVAWSFYRRFKSAVQRQYVCAEVHL